MGRWGNPWLDLGLRVGSVGEERLDWAPNLVEWGLENFPVNMLDKKGKGKETKGALKISA